VRLLSAEDLALEFPDQATPPSPGSPASSPAVPPVPPVLTFTDASVADPAPAADATALDYPALDYASAPDYGVTAGAAAEAAVDADTAYETWTDIDVSALPDAAGDDLSAAAPAADTADTADIAETVNAADAATDPVGTAPDLAEAGDHGAGDLGAGGPTEAELPVPSYDSLSLPSLRARLRGLDVPQLRTLVDYERAHAARADVITMFERRIEKLSAGQ
jgi:hypothetical protein